MSQCVIKSCCQGLLLLLAQADWYEGNVSWCWPLPDAKASISWRRKESRLRLKEECKVTWGLSGVCAGIFSVILVREPQHYISYITDTVTYHPDLAFCLGIRRFKKKVAGVIQCSICIFVPVIQKNITERPHSSPTPHSVLIQNWRGHLVRFTEM